MPNVDGYDLLHRIRSSEDGSVSGLPVIVVTGAENDEAARMRALAFRARRLSRDEQDHAITPCNRAAERRI